MYLPKLFANAERAQLLELMDSNPFATVIAIRDGEPEISHLPLLLLEGEPLRIQGHVAKGNPLAAMIEAGATLTAVFHGPHAYVSPRLYANASNVPTWNYAVVHAHGRAHLLPAEATLPHLRALAASFERGAPEPWRMEHAGELAPKLVPGVLAFELEVEMLEGKFKLNQNRAPEDWHGVVAAFERSDDPQERAVLALMKRQGPPRR